MVLAQLLQIFSMQGRPQNLMPNVFGFGFRDLAIIGSQRKDECIWRGYFSAR
jgi:hypothetical protein